MDKPPKPAQLSTEPEAQFHYDGAGDIYRPLRRLKTKYERYADASQDVDTSVFYRKSARRVGLLIPNRYEEAAMEYLSDADMDFAHDELDRAFALGSGVAYVGGAKLGDVVNVAVSVV
jgi:hypothetical protein